MKQNKERFVWRDGDIAEDDKPPDHRVMSEAEKAYFMKQQDQKQK